MSKHDTDTSDQHAAKRRWLNAHEEGYHKAMGNRRVQMIAIGGAIGTGLFFRRGSPTANGGASTGTGLFDLRPVFIFLFCVHWVSWCYIALPVAALFLMPVSFWVRKSLTLLAGCTSSTGR